MSATINHAIPESVRLAWRLPYGDLSSLLEAAEFEYRNDRVGNAWAAYQLALSQWLRCRWIEHCGRPRSPIVEPMDLANKLRSAQVFDRQLLDMVRPLCTSPDNVMHIHCDVAGAIVKALASE